MGVAEHISPSAVTAISDNDGPSNPPMTSAEKMDVQMFTVVREVKFKKDLGRTFGLLSKRERTVMEPVLTKYMNVFHDYEDNQFKSTDLIERRIVTGDAKPIRNRIGSLFLYAVMEKQVRDMLRKGIIAPSSSPWEVSVSCGLPRP